MYTFVDFTKSNAGLENKSAATEKTNCRTEEQKTNFRTERKQICNHRKHHADLFI
jgi:hypothetical protein